MSVYKDDEEIMHSPMGKQQGEVRKFELVLARKCSLHLLIDAIFEL